MSRITLISSVYRRNWKVKRLLALRFAGVFAVFCSAGHAAADTIQFEGIAPSGGFVSLGATTLLIDGFNVQLISGGSFVDSAQPMVGVNSPSNGTDYLYPAPNGFAITDPTTVPFSLASFQATEVSIFYSGAQAITVSGNYFGGGTISTSFITAAHGAGVLSPFQTFALGAGWDNLTTVTISDSSHAEVFDNIVLSETPAAPLPGVAVAGTTLLAGMGLKRFRRHKSDFAN